jgi:hypothetical protein
MATTPQNEEPGFEADVNELPEDQRDVSERRLEDVPTPGVDERQGMEAKGDAADKRD